VLKSGIIVSLIMLASNATAQTSSPPSGAPVLQVPASGFYPVDPPLRPLGVRLTVICADWQKNIDGTWSTLRRTTVDPGETVFEDSRFRHHIIDGRDLADDLNSTCLPH
jgi:hypothetical protein